MPSTRQCLPNIVGDIDILPKILDLASRFAQRSSNAAMDPLVKEKERAPLLV